MAEVLTDVVSPTLMMIWVAGIGACLAYLFWCW